jgi:hypothetical protein
LPCSSAIATAEFVVPKSMPTYMGITVDDRDAIY